MRIAVQPVKSQVKPKKRALKSSIKALAKEEVKQEQLSEPEGSEEKDGENNVVKMAQIFEKAAKFTVVGSVRH
jgi:hypothetical protein